MNTYGYVYGSPLKYSDPTGQFAFLLPAAEAAIAICEAGGCAALANAAANSIGALGIMAGIAPHPSPVSHADEDEALATQPWNNCEQLKWAISVLEKAIAWRLTDLNPREIGTRNYIGHKQRIKILRDKLKQLKDEYERKCKPENCPAS